MFRRRSYRHRGFRRHSFGRFRHRGFRRRSFSRFRRRIGGRF